MQVREKFRTKKFSRTSASTFLVENSHTVFYTIVEDELRHKMVTRMSIPIINQERSKKKKKKKARVKSLTSEVTQFIGKVRSSSQ